MVSGKGGSSLNTKEKKSQQIAELSERFASSKAIMLTEYKGLKVTEMAELRRFLKEVGAEYKVVKNTMSSIAARGTPAEPVAGLFVGPTGIAFGLDDPIAAVRKLLEYAGKNDKLKVKSGIIEGMLCSADDIKAISKLPPRNVLLSILLGALQSPMSKLAGALNATLSQFAYALEALKNKKSMS